MTVAELRARLKAMTEALSPLKVKALSEGAPAEDRAAFKAHLDAIKVVEEQLDMAEADEALQAKHSQPAGPTATDPAPTVPAVPQVKMPLDQKLSLSAAAIIVGKAQGKDPLAVLQDEGYGQFVGELKKAVNTTTSGEGGILVPTALDGGIIALLRNESTFLDAGPTRVQLVSGAFKQPRGATGATASYVGEGGLKPVSTPTFDSIDMKAKKLAGIVPLTNEAKKWTVGNIEEYIRNDLRQALSLTFDLNAYLGTGSGATPTGILVKAGIQTVTPTFATATAPTLAELDAMASAMILKLTTANIFLNPRWRWVFSYRTVMYLSTIRTTTGDLVFPSLETFLAGKVYWKGIQVIVTNQIPTNGGTGTNETTVSLVDFTHVLFGEESGIVMKMSDQATLVTGAGAAISDLLFLFQQNMFAILAEMEHDVGLRYAKAVVKASAIKF